MTTSYVELDVTLASETAQGVVETRLRDGADFGCVPLDPKTKEAHKICLEMTSQAGLIVVGAMVAMELDGRAIHAHFIVSRDGIDLVGATAWVLAKRTITFSVLCGEKTIVEACLSYQANTPRKEESMHR